MIVRLALAWSTVFIFSFSLAETSSVELSVKAKFAKIYGQASTQARVVTRVKRGRRLKSDGKKVNGFYHLLTKSGRSLWVRSQDVQIQSAIEDVEQDLLGQESLSEPTPEPGRRAEAENFDRFSLDFGISVGSVGDNSYQEINLGANFYFYRWLAWRNAGFARFMSGQDNIYGLDSSVRGILHSAGTLGSVTLFAGPGYRFVNQGDGAPLVEGGLIMRLAFLTLGGGAKVIMNDWVDSTAPRDTQYFLILSGGI